jgi:hypothetical protein
VIFAITAIVGWLVWFVFTSRTAQTPGKLLVHTYTVDFHSGAPVSPLRMWLREVIVILFFVTGFLWLLDLVFFVFDENHRALHDRIMRTAVVWAPDGLPFPEEQEFNKGLRLGDAEQWGRAVEAFTRALSVDPEYADALGYRGLAYGEMGEYDLAKSDLGKALELVDDEELATELREGLARLDALRA